MNNKLLFILSGNLSTTPRAFKVIKLFAENYNIEIVAISRSKKWLQFDNEMLNNLNINYTAIDISRNNFIFWVKATFISFISKFLLKIFRKNIKLNAFISNKATVFIHQHISKSKTHYAKIFAHSYGSLYPAYQLSQNLNIPFIFDVEDYHPGEKCSIAEQKRREFLMQQLLPKAQFITYASPLIGEYTHKLIPNYPKEKMILINNCFSKSEFTFVENNSEKVQFVWFSQNIAPGRGLELVVPALFKFKDKVQLTIIGNLYHSFYDQFLQKYSDILSIHKPLPQIDLNMKLSEFDVGLAIEPGKDLNNVLALSNKIFAYSQAGLFVLATDTQAQNMFLSDNQNIGYICKQDVADMEIHINNIIDNIILIRAQKISRFEYAKKLSWENESQKLKKLWTDFLS